MKCIEFCVLHDRNISDIEEVEECKYVWPNHCCSLKKLIVDDSSDMINYSENGFDIFTVSVFIMMLKEVFLCISVVRVQ